MPTGDLHKFATLYISDSPMKIPIKTNQFDNEFMYGRYPYNTTIEIKNSLSDKYLINWIEINHENRKMFICDRNLLLDISYMDLNRLGLIDGIVVSIDNEKYKLRVLNGNDEVNEWDLYVCNEIENPLLPIIDKLDQNTIAKNEDMWHWSEISSITSQEIDEEELGCINQKDFCVCRGNWNYNSYIPYSKKIGAKRMGWRPILECNYDDVSEDVTYTNVLELLNTIDNELDRYMDLTKNKLELHNIDCSDLTSLSLLIEKLTSLI